MITDLSSERLIRALKKVGFRIVTEGKHTGMSDGVHHVTIPRHKRLNPYTLKGITKDAGLTEKRLKDLI